MISKKGKILYREQGQSFGHYIDGSTMLVGRIGKIRFYPYFLIFSKIISVRF